VITLSDVTASKFREDARFARGTFYDPASVDRIEMRVASSDISDTEQMRVFVNGGTTRLRVARADLDSRVFKYLYLDSRKAHKSG
jgi:hypothetical protein